MMTSPAIIPWLFLAVSLIGAAFTFIAFARIRRIGYMIVPYFFGAWLTGELALHHIAWQAVATIVFVAEGALSRWPGWLALGVTLASWAGLLVLQRRAGTTGLIFEEALRDCFGAPEVAPALSVNGASEPSSRQGDPPLVHDDRMPSRSARAQVSSRVPLRRIARPFKMHDRRVERIRNIPYGDAGHRHMLDIYRPVGASGRCPTLFQIHGGGWTIGRKDQQGLPLMYHMAARGWVCVAANYRLSPRAKFPDHLIDVKRALAWIRQNGARYGADPDFVVVTGGSAGGHLAALVALTANDAEYQPGFEEVDTSVAACVPFYGVYDFLDRHGVRRKASMAPFLQRLVMKHPLAHDREAWEKASPIARVHADAPPFFIIHGTHDSLAFVEDTRHFVEALRRVSRQPVVYAELPGAQHAFDIFHSVRCAYAVDAVCQFLEGVRATRERHESERPHEAAVPLGSA